LPENIPVVLILPNISIILEDTVEELSDFLSDETVFYSRFCDVVQCGIDRCRVCGAVRFSADTVFVRTDE
jgi:hypothetical protein